MVKKSGLVLVWLLLTIEVMYAQSDCVQSLQQARTSFNNGHLYTIPSILKPCLDNGFNKAEKIQAYWLLTQVYLLVDDPISAEDSYLKLLQLDPEYRINEETDPVELVYLSKNFKTTPIYSWHMGKVGLNYTGVNVVQVNSMDGSSAAGGKYKGLAGYQLGAGIEGHMSANLSAVLEAMFVHRSFEYEQILFQKDLLTKSERSNSLDFNLGLKYKFNEEKFAPFAIAGVGTSLLLGSNYSFNYITTQGEEGAFQSTAPSVNNSNQRETFDFNLFLGGGVQWRIKYNFLTIEARYAAGLKPYSTRDNQFPYNNGYFDDKNFKYAYVDDDFRRNGFLLNITWIKPLYKPRKINKTTTKGFFKKLFKKEK